VERPRGPCYGWHLRRNEQIGWLALLVASTVLFALAKDDWGRSIAAPEADGAYYYVYLPSLVVDGDLDFSNQYTETKNWYRLGPTKLGRPGNVFGIGPALLALPTFLLGHGLALITGGRSDGFSRYETWLFTWTSLLYTIAAMFVATRLVRRRVRGPVPPWVGPLVAAVAGPVGYYALRQPGYAHPCATFWVAWFVERWDASFDQAPARSLRTWVGLGALLGAAALARPQLALWGVLLVPAVVDDLRSRGTTSRGRLSLRWGAGGLAALVVFAPQLLAWHQLYGAWYTIPQGPGFMRWDAPEWTATLFSSRNGLFPWAPLYLPFLLGSLRCWRRARALAVVVAFLLQAVANGAAWDWWAGGSFGGRRYDSLYVVAALGAAALVAKLVEVVRAARDRPRTLRGSIAPALAVPALITVLLTSIAELRLAARTSVVSARITGGVAAADVLRAEGGALTGSVAAALSTVITYPLNLAFHLRYGVAVGAYDRVVGVNYLGETFPGLNSYPDKLQDVVRFDGARASSCEGLSSVSGATARLTGPTARILLGFNRRGGVRLRVGVVAEGPVAFTWNGAPLVERDAHGRADLEVVVAEVSRGVNVLAVRAPPSTVVGPIELVATP
jgi:hypothetical protein